MAVIEANIGSLSPVVSLLDIAQIFMGQSPPSNSYNIDGVGLPFFQGKAEFGELYPKAVKWCSRPIKVVKRDTVLISVRAPVGDVNVSPSRCCIGRGLAAIQPNNRVEPFFLFFWLRHSDEWLKARGTGSTFQSVNKNTLMEMPVWLPSLPEQRAIARVLRTVQRAKEATEAVIAATRELKRSLMRHLFTYGPVSSRKAGGTALNETEFGPFPTSWQTMPLGRCATVQTGVTKGRKFEGGEIVELPYLRVANVQDGFLDLADMKYIPLLKSEVSRYLLHDHDVVLTEGGDPDKLGRGFIWRMQVAECVHQNHIFAVRANLDLVTPAYLSYLVQSEYGKAYFLQVAHRTTNLACINSTKLKNFPVLVPLLHEQAEIVQHLVAVDNKLAAEEQHKTALDALFKSLLEHLMTGKVRVPLEPATASEGGF